MQTRALVMLAIAIVIGGVAAYLVNTQLKQKVDAIGTDSAKTVETKPVVVAAINIDIGERLIPSILKTVDWPVAGIPKGAYTDIATAVGSSPAGEGQKAEDPTDPKIVLQTIQEGEVVLPYKISGPGGRGGLAPHIPDDMRAITISVNEIRGVAGFVLPGNHVDLLLTSSLGQQGKKLATRVLLQDVVVLGVAQDISQKKNEPKVVKSVTLLVTPKQAQMLALAQTMGGLTLVLRKEGDTSTYDDEPVTLASLLSENEVAPPPGPKPPPASKPAPKVVKKVVKRSVSKPKVVRRAPSSKVKVDVIRGLSIQQQIVKPAAPTEQAKASGK